MIVAGLLVATGLPVAAAVWRRPQRGLLLLLALLPFDGLLLLVAAPAPVTAWKESLLAGTLLAAAHPRWARDDPPPLPTWVWPLALLSVVALVTIAWSPPLQALVGLKVTFFGVLTAAVVWRCPFSDRDRDVLVTVLTATGIVVALVGLGQQVLGHERLHELGYAYNSVIRFTGGFMRSWSTFNQPFPFAFFLMVVTLLSCSVALADTSRLRNRIALAAIPLYVAGMGVAVVRAAWIGLLVGMAYLAVTRHRVLLAGAPVLAGVVLVGLVLGAGGFFTPPSVEARLSRWQQVPGAMSQAPFGYGIGTAGAAAAKTETLAGGTPTFDPSRVKGTRVVFQPDNAYFKIMFELGVLGAALFVLVLLAAFAGTRQAEEDPDLGPFAGGASAVIVAAAAASLASSFFEIFPLDYVFWMVVGIATIRQPIRRQPPVPQPPLVAVRSAA